MIHVIHEIAEAQSAEGKLELKIPAIRGEIQISPEIAQRHAKGYLTERVAMSFRPGAPTLIWGERPLWRMTIFLFLRYWGEVATLGVLDVDAMTGRVLPLSPEQITAMQERADAIASRLTPQTTPTI